MGIVLGSMERQDVRWGRWPRQRGAINSKADCCAELSVSPPHRRDSNQSEAEVARLTSSSQRLLPFAMTWRMLGVIRIAVSEGALGPAMV